MAETKTQNPTPQTPPPAVAQPRRKPRHLLIRILGAFVVLGLLVFFLTPVVLSMGWAQRRVVALTAAALDAPVSLEGYSLSWFSGVTVKDLTIGNPRSFPKRGDLLRLREASFDMSLPSYLVGAGFVVSAKVDGLELRVHQLQDGRTNLSTIGGSDTEWQVSKRSDPGDRTHTHPHTRPRPRTDPDRLPAEPDPDADMLADLELDVSLANALIEVTDEKLGVLESMRNLNVSVRKESGALDLVCKLDAELHQPGASSADGKPASPGTLSARADIDIARSRPWTFHLATTAFDLARYRPLLAWGLSANPFEKLQGVLSGKADATMQPDGSTTVTGKLVLAQPHFKTLGDNGIDVRGDAFVLEPNVAFHLDEGTRKPEKLDLNGFRVDLGFFKATGIPAAEAQTLAGGKQALGLRYDVDLAGLTSIGGIVPAELHGTRGTVTGQLLFVPSGALDDIDPLKDLSTAAQVFVEQLDHQGYALRNLRGDLALADGKASFKTTGGTTLNGGSLRIDAKGTLDEEQHLPANFEVAWQGGKARGDAVRLLRYAVPLLAGLDVDSKLDFESDIDTTIQLTGPLLRAEDESVLQWLNHWQGAGKLALLNGGFTPAKQLGELLTFAGERNRLTFKNVDTDFVIKEGGVETKLLKMNRKAQTYGFRGKVFMDGRIDYQIALQDALKGHRDGEKIRRYLGDTPIEAKLAGTLDDPKLAMPEMSAFLQKALEAEAKKGIDDALKKGLDKIFKRDKKDRKKKR
ncbi:MAG: AsmA family protein [Planctomycetota bacterium]|jgi:hypothetical protein